MGHSKIRYLNFLILVLLFGASACRVDDVNSGSVTAPQFNGEGFGGDDLVNDLRALKNNILIPALQELTISTASEHLCKLPDCPNPADEICVKASAMFNERLNSEQEPFCVGFLSNKASRLLELMESDEIDFVASEAPLIVNGQRVKARAPFSSRGTITFDYSLVKELNALERGILLTHEYLHMLPDAYAGAHLKDVTLILDSSGNPGLFTNGSELANVLGLMVMDYARINGLFSESSVAIEARTGETGHITVIKGNTRFLKDIQIGESLTEEIALLNDGLDTVTSIVFTELPANVTADASGCAGPRPVDSVPCTVSLTVTGTSRGKSQLDARLGYNNGEGPRFLTITLDFRVLQPFLVVGNYSSPVPPVLNSIPSVADYDFDGNPIAQSNFAMNSFYPGTIGTRVAVGDINGDGLEDVVVAPGKEYAADVIAYSGRDKSEIFRQRAFAGFMGGVYVATGDTDNDGFDDIIVSADAGGGPHVKVYSGRTGQLIQSFFSYNPAFTGGVRVASCDYNGDGKADIVTGAGIGGGPHVRIFSGAGSGSPPVLADFFAGEFPATTFHTGGIHVACGDIDGTGFPYVVVGVGNQVRIYNNRSNLASFNAFPADGSGASPFVQVADVNGDGKDDIFFSSNPNTGFTTLNPESGKGFNTVSFPARVSNFAITFK